MTPVPSPSAGRVVWYSLESGVIVRVADLRFDPALVDPQPAVFAGALEAWPGSLVGRIGRGTLAWFDSDGRFEELVRLPHLAPTFPTERDVERYIADMRFILRRDPTPEQVQEFRRRDLSPLLRGQLHRVTQADSRGRLWIAATRLGRRGSFLHLVHGPEYQGSIQVEDQLLAFQLQDSLLVALVESLTSDSVGLFPRRIDWYRIVDARSVD